MNNFFSFPQCFSQKCVAALDNGVKNKTRKELAISQMTEKIILKTN
jgi:hypothetical protein